MKNSEIIQLYNTLQEITQDTSQTYDTKLAYKLLKAKAAIKDTAEIVLDLRKQIWLKYGQEENDNIVIPAEKVPEAEKEFQELFEIENDIKLPTITLDEIEGIKWKLETMEGLSPIIKDPGEN